MKRIGIVGVGGFAARVLRSILLVESEGLAALEGAVIRNPAKHPEVIRRLKEQGRSIYVSLSDMIQRAGDKIDIISLPVGIPSHSPLAIQAMEAGYHVVLEKPIAATIQEVDALMETSARTGRLCVVGFQHIYTPALQMLREEIERGRLGKIRRAKTYGLWPRSLSYYQRNVWAGQIWAEGNWVLDGPITNACAHFLNNMLYLVDIEAGGQATIDRLQGELYHAKDIPTYDTGCLRLYTNTGAEVLFLLTHAVDKLTNPITEIEAENATVTWTYDGAKAVVRYRDGVVRAVEGEGNDSHAEAFRDAIAVLEGRKSEPIFTVRHGRNHVLAVDLLFESSGGIRMIPPSEHELIKLPKGDERLQVKGMAGYMEEAFVQGKLLSEVGTPWATPGREVSGHGYTHMPQSEELRTYLEPYIGQDHSLWKAEASTWEWS